MEPFVKITELQKRIDDFTLGPINLSVEPGTITTLVGNNSAGKSTLFKLMMNLVKADMGNVKLFGKIVTGENESWKKDIAYLPQKWIGADPFDGNTLKELISYWYPNWDDYLFEDIVKQFNIPLNKQYGKLSPGVQKKLHFALTISRNTKLLLLDEPTAFMDIPAKKLLIDILTDWMELGDRSIVIASHQIDDIKKLSDFIFVLRNGQMIGNYEKEALVANYQRYWLKSCLPAEPIPGEVYRQENQLISNNREITEAFFARSHIQLASERALDLDEIIDLLLRNEY